MKKARAADPAAAVLAGDAPGASAPGASAPGASTPGVSTPGVIAPHQVERVLLLDRRAEDLRRVYLATAPRPIAEALAAVDVRARPWRDSLLRCLGDMAVTDAERTAVVIADAPAEANMHEAGRAARLHPGTPVFVLSSDGAGVTGAFLRIALPLSAPGLATTAIFTFLFAWNDFFYSLLLTRSEAVTAPVAIVNFMNYESWEWGKVAAAATMIMLPVVALSVVVRKYLVRGLTAGAVKG